MGILRTLATGSELGTLRTLATGSELGTLRTLTAGSELRTLERSLLVVSWEPLERWLPVVNWEFFQEPQFRPVVNVGGVIVVQKDAKIYSTTLSTIIKAGQYLYNVYIYI